ncbi:hypothetical protein EVAR_83816_1 [Eumeta japonica]|uniref:Uncharacterized protein n=1 Tax=Eumeta variegata TaxID=151549 RepID=A0A4C1WIA9_EUMVA|nr:hypothetical protein EVAR_83816_1 [Eumeta japonica]
MDDNDAADSPELKCDRFTSPFSESPSRGRFLESVISGLGQKWVKAARGAGAGGPARLRPPADCVTGLGHVERRAPLLRHCVYCELASDATKIILTTPQTDSYHVIHGPAVPLAPTLGAADVALLRRFCDLLHSCTRRLHVLRVDGCQLHVYSILLLSRVGPFYPAESRRAPGRPTRPRPPRADVSSSRCYISSSEVGTLTPDEMQCPLSHQISIRFLKAPVTHSFSHLILYLFLLQRASNALGLELSVSMGDSERLLFVGSHARLPF